MFWCNMSPNGQSSPDDQLTLALSDSFGGIDDMRKQFLAAGTSIQGSGWAALSWEPLSRSLLVEQVYDHPGNIGNGTLPVLVMDMWEHAFYLQYRNEKQKWAKAFWDLINWKDVSKRLLRVQNVSLFEDDEPASQGRVAAM
jgi:Fe-Mn family superoxide dismutase